MSNNFGRLKTQYERYAQMHTNKSVAVRTVLSNYETSVRLGHDTLVLHSWEGASIPYLMEVLKFLRESAVSRFILSIENTVYAPILYFLVTSRCKVDGEIILSPTTSSRTIGLVIVLPKDESRR